MTTFLELQNISICWNNFIGIKFFYY